MADVDESPVKVFQEAVPAALTEAILKQAETLAACPNYWLSKKEIDGLDQLQAHQSVEAAIGMLFNSYTRGYLENTFAGAEWWVQVYEPGCGLTFHYDKDETLFKEKQLMTHPVWSSILYLTGPSSKQALGPTVVIDQKYDNSTRTSAPDPPSKCVLIWPKQHQFAMFDGRLAHGVLDSASREARVTLLINWWTTQPKAVHSRPSQVSGSDPALERDATRHAQGTAETTCLTGAVSASNLSAQSPVQSADTHIRESPLGGDAEARDTTKPHTESRYMTGVDRTHVNGHHTDSPDREVVTKKLQEMTVSPQDKAEIASSVQCPSTTTETTPARGCQTSELVQISLPPGGDDVITVDDLLDSFKLDITSNYGITAVGIQHSGYQLYPVDAEDEDQIQSLTTAAAFVPSHMLSVASESDSE